MSYSRRYREGWRVDDTSEAQVVVEGRNMWKDRKNKREAREG